MACSSVKAVAVAAVLCLASTAAGAETFTLSEALGVAYETNPSRDAQRAGQRDG